MLDQFTSSIVGILAEGSVIVGTGFLISEKYVVTCAHVVAQALNISKNTSIPPKNKIYLNFPWIMRGKSAIPNLTSHVIFWRTVTPSQNGGNDVAILALDSTSPEGSQPSRMVSENDLWGHSFRTFGFPGGCDKCVLAKGVIRDKLPNGRIVLEDVNRIGFFVSPGFSGAPIWDNQLNGIVGMIVEVENYPDIRTAYMIPINQLIELLPVLNQKTVPDRKEILIDNFTIQGAYCYLFEGARGNIYTNCLSNLIECIVLYDRVKAPQDTLCNNSATREIGEFLNGIITGCKIPWEDEIKKKMPYLTYHGILPKSIKSFYETLGEDPFARFEKEKHDLLTIHNKGRIKPELIMWINLSSLFDQMTYYLSFQARHLWYTLYCMRLAWEHKINYLPNPTRVPIINNNVFNREIFIPEIRRIIINKLYYVRKKHIEKVCDFFKLKTLSLKMPILLNYILRTGGDNANEILKYTLELRNSDSAKAYRQWAFKLEKAIETEDVASLSREIEELENTLIQWTRSLKWETTKRVNINVYTSFNVEVSEEQTTNHLVFLHQLLS